MFVSTTPPITLNKCSSHCSCVASRKRPILYVSHGETLYEISLITGESHKIAEMPICYDLVLACDENDVLYVRRWSHTGVNFHRLSRVTIQERNSPCQVLEGWRIEDLSGYQGCSSVRYSYEHFSSMMNENTYYWHHDHSYVNGKKFNYWDGSVWRVYDIIGNHKPCLSHASSFPYWVLPYKYIEKDAYLVYFRQSSFVSQLWIAHNGQMSMIWEQGAGEPSILTYSPTTNMIYGISIVWEVHSEESTYCTRPISLLVLVYQFETFSLFNQCVRIIKKYPHLQKKVPPCLQEIVNFPITERLQQQREKCTNKDLTDDELRNRYCLI